MSRLAILQHRLNSLINPNLRTVAALRAEIAALQGK